MFAVGPAGETQQLVVKGVNWYAPDRGGCLGPSSADARACMADRFGMESEARVPLGLWSKDYEGSTLVHRCIATSSTTKRDF